MSICKCIYTKNNTKSWCFRRAGFSSRQVFVSRKKKTYLITKWWTFGMSITTYCIKSKINLIYEVNIVQNSSLSLCFSPFCSTALVKDGEITREVVLLSWLQSWCHPASTLSEMLSSIALGCRCVSRGAIFSPSSPVIRPDGCKAALLQNMSRAGEEEVGVESGKGQRPKTSPRFSSCSHMLWHPSGAVWNIKTGCQAATNERANLFWNVFVYF